MPSRKGRKAMKLKHWWWKDLCDQKSLVEIIVEPSQQRLRNHLLRF